MHIKIKNYRGIEEAAIVADPTALICGPNGAGKTSIIQAAAAALTGHPVPIDGLGKAEGSRMLLREGAKRGQCMVHDGSALGVCTANWPGGSTSVEGDRPPKASAIACGLVSVAEMRPKDAVLAIIETMDATPGESDLAKALAEADLPEELLAPVWAMIKAEGWDAALARAKDKGSRLKGAWEQVTGERYGSAKAASWQAPGTPDSAEGLDQLLAEQQAALEAAIAHQAVGEAEIARLREQVEAGKAEGALIKGLEAKAAELRARYQECEARLSQMPKPDHGEDHGTPCPHCGEPVLVRANGVLEVYTPKPGLSADENKRRQEAISAMSRELSEQAFRIREVDQRIARAVAIVDQGKRAAARLADLPEGGATAEQVQAAREAVAATQRQLDAARRTAQAHELAQKIEQAGRLVDILSPTGLRQRMLETSLAELNTTVGHLCDHAGWEPVAIGADMAVTYGGRPYVLLSASEQFRCRVALQVAMADLDGSDLILIDAADILDRQGRNGLFTMLGSVKAAAVVCMTMNRVEEAPDLAAANLGRTYWVGDGVAAPISRKL